MAQTVAQLGARALRKLRVAIVADANGPPDPVTFTSQALALRALREIGLIVPEANWQETGVTVAPAEICARALRAVGVNPMGAPLIANYPVSSEVTTNASNIAGEVLIRLGVYDANESPSAADVLEVETALGNVIDSLNANNVIDFLSGAIPAHAAEYLIIMTVNVVGAAFGKPGNLETYDHAEQKLIQMALTGPSGQNIALAKLNSVHDGVVALGLVSFGLAAVPSPYVESYVEMLAALLMPVYVAAEGGARSVDHAAWQAAEARIRQVAMVEGALAIATQRIAAVQSELNAANLVTWTSDLIPQSVADAVTDMVVQSIGPAFARPFDPKAYAEAMRRVRMVAMGGAAGQALAEQKVRVVHIDLDARGKTRWSLFDLPDYAEEPYVLMAAALLAPEVEVQPSGDWWAQGEMMLDRIIMLDPIDAPLRACYF